ncbi:dihydrofolate reductase [Parabacteroides sp. OttesenSCG-928-G06]|nr:dihydrofolate reductase [Parabacteroides sp. OttesenSCG-928-G06]
MSTLSLVAAIADNYAIGKDGDLLWRLPNDMKYFRELTTGHTVVMGRKTFESLPKGALPNRVNVVLSSRDDLQFEGCTMAKTIEDAVRGAVDEELFVIGGGQIYAKTLPMADKLYLTWVHHTFDDADTFFPSIDFSVWEEVFRESHPADEKHPYPYTFATYVRKK